MNYIVLSGGSGKRLWPLSNEVRSKQFLKIFKKDDGSHESMVQRMYRMIKDEDSKANIVIATSENQVSSIQTQLEDHVSISIEPCRRDTFPAIALATAYLHDIQGISAEEVVIVCPIDPYVNKDYYQMMGRMNTQAQKEEANIVLMGIEPTFASNTYGYIIPKSKDQITTVEAFAEKPDIQRASEYIARGALWNAGVFAFKIKYVLDTAKKLLGSSDYKWLQDNYSTFDKISFDYAVVEKEKSIQVMRFAGQWKDLGTWNTMTEAMSDEIAGNAVEVECKNTHVINELQIPLIALGLSDVVVAATPDGILVTDKKHSNKLKEHVSDQRPMYEKRIWGEYQILDYHIQPDGLNYLTKHLVIKPGKHISYQLHHHRTEMWVIVDGTGVLITDGVSKKVSRGDFTCIAPETKHAIVAYNELHIIEVQVGDELTEEDIERLNWNFDNSCIQDDVE